MKDPVAVDAFVFYEQRIIVLMENGPQTNQYHQVMLDKEQMKKLTVDISKLEAISPQAPEGTVQQVRIECDDSRYMELPTEIKSVNR